MKKFLCCLLVLTSLISIFFVIKMTAKLRSYFSLNTSVEALITDWKVLEKAPSSFILAVSYQFYDGNQTVEGSVELAKPHFSNLSSAEVSLRKFSQRQWDVFYSSSDSKISSLQKIFPFKECIQVFLTLGVLVYCFILRKIAERSNVY